MIFGAHVVALIAALSLGGVVVIAQSVPLLVQILPERPAEKPPIPSRTLPLPVLREPDIKLPSPPPIENLYMVRVEEKPAPAPITPPAQVSVSPAPALAPAVEPPRFDMAYLNNPAPSYPVFAKRAREQGVVLLRVQVDADGGVEEIRIHKSSGSQRLDDAALAAVKRWRFVPARSGDRAVAGIALVPIHFQLES
jgi:protein TonB